MKPFFVDNNGKPMERTTAPIAPEVAPTEPINMAELCREAAEQAKKDSTKDTPPCLRIT